MSCYWEGTVPLRKDAPLSALWDSITTTWASYFDKVVSILNANNTGTESYMLSAMGPGIEMSIYLHSDGNPRIYYFVDLDELDYDTLESMDNWVDLVAAPVSSACWKSIESDSHTEIVHGPSALARKAFIYEEALVAVVGAYQELTGLGDASPADITSNINQIHEKFLWQTPNTPGGNSVSHTWQSLLGQPLLQDAPVHPVTHHHPPK